jgi:hypothetical protein
MLRCGGYYTPRLSSMHGDLQIVIEDLMRPLSQKDATIVL